MSNIETTIKDIVQEKLESGLVEKIVAEQLEAGLNKAIGDIFNSWGKGTKTIKDKIESVMIPYLENYDYSKYIIKLDEILVNVLKNSAATNTHLLENFKSLMSSEKVPFISATDLFNKWCDFVAYKVDTSGLKVVFEDEPAYESVDVRMELVENEGQSWSCFESASLVFTCEWDEEVNIEIPLSRYKRDKENEWTILGREIADINSLRYLDKFEVLLMNLKQCGTKIIMDSKYDNEYITPAATPEASFS